MHKSIARIGMSLGVVLIFGGSAQASTSNVPKVREIAAPVVVQPQPVPKLHTVGAGDSLSSIAEQEQLESWRPLWNANPGLENPDLVYEGQQLVVPQGPVADRALPANTIVEPVVSRAVSRPSQSVANYAAGAGGLLKRIRMREAGGNYATNTGNGFYGAYQFSLGTWQGVGGSGLPSEASPAEQDMRAQLLYNQRGCSPWPNTCY